MENELEETQQHDTNEVPANEAPQPTEAVPAANESWVKSNGKMTTSLPGNIQALIRELSPSNVLNISQFITWILQAYQAQTIENTALQSNQDTLNQKLKEAYDSIETLEAGNAILTQSLSTLNDQPPTIDTPPAPSHPAVKEQPNYLRYLGL